MDPTFLCDAPLECCISSDLEVSPNEDWEGRAELRKEPVAARLVRKACTLGLSLMFPWLVRRVLQRLIFKL